jgi:hypothetical protein
MTAALPKLKLPADMPTHVTGDFDLAGAWPLPASSDLECLWVVNGDLKNAQMIQPITNAKLPTSAGATQWHLRVDTSRWSDATAQRVVLLARHAQSKAVVAVSESMPVHL